MSDSARAADFEGSKEAHGVICDKALRRFPKQMVEDNKDGPVLYRCPRGVAKVHGPPFPLLR